MVNRTIDSGLLWAAAVTVFIFGGLVAHFSEEFVLAYPLDTWRMDLDDLIGNIGTFLVGVAALIGLKRAHRKIDQNGTKERELDQREEFDYQRLRAEFEEIKARFDEATERRQP